MDLEERLVRRYHQLVRSHMITSDLLSAGVKSSLKSNKAFNQTQAAWRFFNNESCELSELVKPILTHAVMRTEECQNYGLVVHDWSGLSYISHSSKKDRFGIHNKQELGYELQASLLIHDGHGGPIAPVALNVVTDKKVLSTYSKELHRDATHLEELANRIHYIERCEFKKPLVHIVDREGDSVQLMRALEGRLWLVRCRSNSNVEYQGMSIRVDELAKKLEFSQARAIQYKGRKAEQYLAETEVLITRAARPKKTQNDGSRNRIKGDAVACRCIISRVQDLNGNLLAHWYLLSNVETVSMDVIALWYYWRWSIETFFKLLKSAGMQLESWQQETGEAIARRLLIACMACACVWQIAMAEGPEAGEIRNLLVRLSGKQMKYGVKFTKPALFTGLCALLNAFDLLERYDPGEIKQMLHRILGEAFV
jgi:hypothetical protein